MGSSNPPPEATASSYGLSAVDPPVPMLILERDLRIRWISTAAIREFRLKPEQLIGRSWYELFPESIARRDIHEALCRGERDGLDLPRTALTLGCATRYFSLRLRPLRGPDGLVESILGLGEDVTAQVEAEATLAPSSPQEAALEIERARSAELDRELTAVRLESHAPRERRQRSKRIRRNRSIAARPPPRPVSGGTPRSRLTNDPAGIAEKAKNQRPEMPRRTPPGAGRCPPEGNDHGTAERSSATPLSPSCTRGSHAFLRRRPRARGARALRAASAIDEVS